MKPSLLWPTPRSKSWRKSHQKKHKQKKSHLRNRPFYFQRLPMVDENAIFLTMKDRVGSIRNFREYKRNESSFPQPAPGRVVQLPMLDPGLWMGITRTKSRLSDQGIAISRSFQYPSMQLWQNLQSKKLQWPSSHTDTRTTAITGSALVALVGLTSDSVQMPAEENELDCIWSDGRKLGIC